NNNCWFRRYNTKRMLYWFGSIEQRITILTYRNRSSSRFKDRCNRLVNLQFITPTDVDRQARRSRRYYLKRWITECFVGNRVEYNFLVELCEFHFEQFNTILVMKSCTVNPTL